MWAFSWFVSIIILGINFYFVAETLVCLHHHIRDVQSIASKMAHAIL